MRSVYRQFLLGLISVGIAFAAQLTGAQEEPPPETNVSHGISAFGDLKYLTDFEHFEYVNPQAPKGGSISTTPVYLPGTTFDSFNGFILKGDEAAGLKFETNDGGSLLFDSLLIQAWDEPDAMYGLVAYEVEYPPDRSWITFRLRSEAKFHDGSPLEAKDVVYSVNLLKEKGDPFYRQNLRDVESAEILGDHEVKFTFAEAAEKRDLPLVVAKLPIFSKAYYSENKFEESNLKKPLGSGPYTIGSFQQGRFVEYDRVKDYWAMDLPVNVGRWNFDKVRFEYYRDRTVSFQAFTANEYDLREEFTSRVWSTQYNFPAIQDGRVIKRSVADERIAGVQGAHINLRRTKFSDVRTRQALDYAFDYEWMNKNLFYGLYDRTTSYFQGSDVLVAEGKPSLEELEILNLYREQLPYSVFEVAYVPPVTDGSGRIRGNLSKARGLLEEAGWSVVDGKLVDAAGEQFEIEFLTYQPSSERVFAPYVKNLKLLGIDAQIRMVDAPQYERRKNDFDFDISTTRFGLGNSTPSVSLRNLYSSAAADSPGSFNMSGIKDPVVDDLIEKMIGASTRAEYVLTARALDRVLRTGHYWVSEWSNSTHNIAYWDKFVWPDIKPKYDRGIIDTWWSKDAGTASRDDGTKANK
jgi:microcin C transport system substrate-binding protein